jgi:hypothetical protein
LESHGFSNYQNCCYLRELLMLLVSLLSAAAGLLII